MDRAQIAARLDEYRDTFVEEYNAFKLKSGVPGRLARRAARQGLLRNYYGLQYYSPDGKWSRPEWRPSLGERLFFLKHRLLSKIPGRAHRYSEADQKRLWLIRGGENYSFESETPSSRGFAERFFREFFQMVDVADDASIMELGCGSGRNLSILKELGFTDLRGVDFSVTQVEFCRERGFDVRLMNIAELDFPDRSFDLVFTNSVLLHVPPDRITRVLHEAIRVSRNLTAFREDTYESELFEGHVYKYNYLERLNELGFRPERVGEFMVIRRDPGDGGSR